MNLPPLFRDRPLPVQVILGGVVPAAFGAVVGLLLGVSAAAYWGIQIVAVAGGILAGFEHRDGWGGADRGLVGGALFGTFLLVAHELSGTHATVALPSFPPMLAVFTAIIGMLLGALGGRLGRALRERPAAQQVGKTARQLEPID
ncbi:MAG TPA: hypothetical protein VGY97_02460 [Solirubrobacteraceae bacterium]|jgi:hypothetical protein|nr:hypothetical protein [Solirubrobacteraceae bacterium]